MKAVTIGMRKRFWDQPVGLRTRRRGKSPAQMFGNPAIVYVKSNGGLWMCDADGLVHVALLQGQGESRCSNPAWSPDGRQIAFLERSAWRTDVCIVGTDGSDYCSLGQFSKESAGFVPSFFRWMPDGQALMLRSLDSTDKVCILTIATGELAECSLSTKDIAFPDDRFSLSPNYCRDVEGFHGLMALSAFPKGLQPDIEEDLFTLEIAWEPNQLFESSNPQQVTFTPDLIEQEPAFSRDGSWISYNRSRPGMEDWTTVVAAFPEQGLDSIIGDYHNVTWAPDGRWLAFQRETERLPDGSVACDIYRAKPDGTDLALLSLDSGGNKSMPNWNPAWENDIDP